MQKLDSVKTTQRGEGDQDLNAAESSLEEPRRRVATYFLQRCPFCSQPQQVPVSRLGHPVSCRNCGRRFVASAPDRSTSDEQLARRIESFLRQRHVPAAGSIQVEVAGGNVVLRGTLPSRQAKWLCIQCCQRVAGVVHVVDQLSCPTENQTCQKCAKREDVKARPAKPR